jgi:hypothetical protein
MLVNLLASETEKRSTDHVLLLQALDRYVDDVIAMNHGTTLDEVPVILKESFARSLQANIEYHQMMSVIHAKDGNIVMADLHKTKLAVYESIIPK